MWAGENRMGDDSAAVRWEENTFRSLATAGGHRERRVECKHAAPPNPAWGPPTASGPLEAALLPLYLSLFQTQPPE